MLGGKLMFFGISPQLSVGSSDYLSAFFGVNKTQSSGSGLSTYEINDGVLSYGLHTSVVVPLTNHISVIGFGRMDVLAEDVADSPLVAMCGSDKQGSAGFALNVSF
ncbi:MAG: outer membrane scaffolding protein for murein synthesis (MipA/OmpV family) [bacterium]